ncbi:MAG TPA: GNAT family N-acetyltransferase [archaeon]|nr:GNAT family N-acetyltransferase [archaeon]
MESVLIRKAKAEDVGDIIQLLKELQTGHIGLEISAAERKYIQKKDNVHDFWKSLIEKSLQNTSEHLLVAVVEGKVAGYLKAEIKQRSQVNIYDKKLYIRYLIVSEKFRNLGVGTKLLKEAEKFAKENNIPFIVLKTSPKNKQTRDFYKSLGFEDIYMEMVKEA